MVASLKSAILPSGLIVPSGSRLASIRLFDFLFGLDRFQLMPDGKLLESFELGNPLQLLRVLLPGLVRTSPIGLSPLNRHGCQIYVDP